MTDCDGGQLLPKQMVATALQVGIWYVGVLKCSSLMLRLL